MQERKAYPEILFYATGFALMIAGCNPRHPDVDPVGTWENTTHWDNNVITLKVQSDSTMLFKTEKATDAGTRFLVAVGKWHVEEDSFLVMEPYTDGRQIPLNQYFPELTQVANDSGSVSVLEVSARLIMRDSLIYDLKPDGTAEPARTYRKTSK